jgi:S-disulfanyl-L-cysteine oxidoreductase SoxD
MKLDVLRLLLVSEGARPRRLRGIAAVSLLSLAPILAISCRHPSTGAKPAGEMPSRFGIGHPATAGEIRAWDIDVRADGRGLPPDSGSAVQGAAIYASKCAACHGADGIHGVVPPAPPLIGRQPGDAFPFATDTAAVATVGNYWPYATTLYDYIHRAMPLSSPGSLSPHEVYAVSAFILARNGIVAPNAELNARTLPLIRMPARNRFVPDDRTGGPRVR